MDKHTIFIIVGGSFLLILSIIGAYILFEELEEYVLWCVDKKGIEIPIIFRGMNENDIDAIGECREIMFEPVEYYINLKKDT